MVGAGYRFGKSREDNLDFNVGLNIKDWVQIITQVYSSARYRLRDYTDGLFETMIRVRIPDSAKPE
jgi:hypothetical protein